MDLCLAVDPDDRGLLARVCEGDAPGAGAPAQLAGDDLEGVFPGASPAEESSVIV